MDLLDFLSRLIKYLLFIADPYHAYYRHKVKEFLEGKGHEPATPKPVATVKVITLNELLIDY